VRAAHLAATASALAVLAATGPASANGRYPASNQILFSPGDPGLVVLRATFGILLSHDAGATWTWLCESALGLPAAASEDPSLAVTGSDAIVAGIYGGLETSPDTGCTWSFAGGALANQNVVDVTVRRDAPRSVLALTSTYAQDAGVDGSSGYLSQVYESADDGAHWAPFGVPIDPAVTVTSLDVVAGAGGALTVYAVGFRVATPTAPVFLVGTASGWTPRPMPPLSHEISMYIAGIDPGAGLVYLRSEGAPIAGQSRLFVTGDQGQSFQAPLVLSGPMLGFALSPDGATIYAGSAQDGLYVGSRGNLDASTPFRKASSIHVQCLAARGTELWACSDEASGFVAGVSTDEGATFAPKLHLNGIQSAIACPADATATQCSGAAFQQLCQSLKGCAAQDGGADAATGADAAGMPDGASDGGSDASAGGAEPHEGGAETSPPTASGGCSGGCSAAGGGAAPGIAASIAAVPMLLRRRTRRRGPT
jgi:hypothetical protein